MAATACSPSLQPRELKYYIMSHCSIIDNVTCFVTCYNAYMYVTTHKMTLKDSLDQYVEEIAEHSDPKSSSKAGNYLHILSPPLEILKTKSSSS